MRASPWSVQLSTKVASSWEQPCSRSCPRDPETWVGPPSLFVDVTPHD